MKTVKARNPHLTLHRLLRLLQQKNRFISKDLEMELGIVESIIMLELDGDPSRTASDLVALFDLDKSTISRHLKALQQKAESPCENNENREGNSGKKST